jgi:hypothetical protein
MVAKSRCASCCWLAVGLLEVVERPIYRYGLQVQNRIAAKLDLKSLDYSSQRGKRFYQDWIERVAACLVQSVSIASYLPLETTSLTIGVLIAGQNHRRSG